MKFKRLLCKLSVTETLKMRMYLCENIHCHLRAKFTAKALFKKIKNMLIHPISQVLKTIPVLIHVIVPCQHRPHRLYKPYLFFPKKALFLKYWVRLHFVQIQ